MMSLSHRLRIVFAGARTGVFIAAFGLFFALPAAFSPENGGEAAAQSTLQQTIESAKGKADEGDESRFIYRPKTFTPHEILLMYVSQNSTYDNLIQALVERQLTIIKPHCATADRIVRQLPEPYYAVAFPPNMRKEGAPEHPISGQWREVLKLKACNRVHTFNFLVSAASHGLPLPLPLLNGESIIDPIYQTMAENKVAEALKLKNPEQCAQGGTMLVQDTRLLGYIQADRSLGKDNDDRGWFEEWDVWNCREHAKARVAMIMTDLGSFDIRVQVL